MKVFIFGAGASKSSQEALGLANSNNRAAPLVDELFDERYAEYAKQIGLSLSDLAEYHHDSSGWESLEQWLTSKWENINKISVEGIKKAEYAEFGRLTFYVWRTLQLVSNTYGDNNGYRKLLKVLKKQGEYPGMISFNYDTLLDRAVKKVYGVNFLRSIQSYSEAKLIKPHGSVNWLLPKRGSDALPVYELSPDDSTRYDLASNSMFNGAPLNANSSVVYDPEHPDLNRLELIHSPTFEGAYFYPLILIPLTTKLYPFFTNFEEAVINPGKKLVAEADEIYMVGYRAADDIIKEMLQATKPETKLHIVGTRNASAIMSRVLSYSPRLVEGQTFSEGFEMFIKDYERSTANTHKVLM